MSDRVDVVGTGTAQVQPDVLQVQVGAEVTADDVASAMESVEWAVRAMVQAARHHGLTDADIQTSGLSLHTHHDHNGRAKGFRAWNQVLLTLRDLDAAGTVLSQVVASGGDASRVQGMRLAASEPGAGLDAAREAAVADARHQAGELARLAGRELGGVRRITTSTARASGNQVQMEWMEQSGRQSGLPIEAGFSTVTVSVHVRFDLV